MIFYFIFIIIFYKDDLIVYFSYEIHLPAAAAFPPGGLFNIKIDYNCKEIFWEQQEEGACQTL